ncbi:ribonuclease T [Psychrobacter sp. I-STPA6b]|uniref:ribonuclease T n=1 Tax=Psychrobacter sp. I-STPA6b TaxID=2585718 RepID=UPI001D0C4945|nr:ribonuclease T [Psychrobacter sp. I-STPA6b]
MTSNSNILTTSDDTQPNVTNIANTVSTEDGTTPSKETTDTITKLNERFRKFMPVVVDVETAGFNAQTDALLEIACIPILMDETGRFYQGEPLNAHIEPFEGANLEARALEFTGIDPTNPLRKAIAEDEKTALRRIFKGLKEVRREHDCRQCVLVGHNAHFDLNFLNAAIARTNSKNHSPFHAFSVLDTVTLSALAFGQTVLARACKAAGIDFNGSDAHSALYDTQKTAELFCHILNQYPMLANAMHQHHENSETDAEDCSTGSDKA